MLTLLSDIRPPPWLKYNELQKEKYLLRKFSHQSSLISILVPHNSYYCKELDVLSHVHSAIHPDAIYLDFDLVLVAIGGRGKHARDHIVSNVFPNCINLQLFAYILGCILDSCLTFFILLFFVYYYILLVHFYSIYPKRAAEREAKPSKEE